MKSDFHMHTNFSTDSDSTPEQMIEGAIQKGLQTICITDHQDVDFPKSIMPAGFQVDFEKYFENIGQKKYKAVQIFDWLYKKRVNCLHRIKCDWNIGMDFFWEYNSFTFNDYNYIYEWNKLFISSQNDILDTWWNVFNSYISINSGNIRYRKNVYV